jgi:hypothetical protein
VGWDDSLGDHGVWIIKNSWGTNWGDEGYIKLPYGTNNIGFAASWVLAKPTSGPSVSLMKNLTILNKKNELLKFYPQLSQLR